jgi:hypothetical protein
VFERLPLVDNVVPTRLMVHAWLLIAAVVAVVLARAAAMPRGRTRAVTFGAVAVSLLALVPRPLPSQPAATPAFFTGAARHLPAGTTLLVAPWSDPFDTRAMV